jgi:hypothetical protein
MPGGRGEKDTGGEGTPGGAAKNSDTGGESTPGGAVKVA